MTKDKSEFRVFRGCEFEEMIPLQELTLPKIPDHVLTGWAGDFAKALSVSTQTPIELCYPQVLAAVSIACARRTVVHVRGDWYEATNIWLMTPMEPASRKSAVLNTITDVMSDWESNKREQTKELVQRTQTDIEVIEARIRRLMNLIANPKTDELKVIKYKEDIVNLKAKMPEPVHSPQLFTSDCTAERVGSLMKENEECLGWVSSEGGVFSILKGRYSGGDFNLDLFLKAYSGDAEKTDRLGRDAVHLKKPALTFALSPQLGIMRDLISNQVFRERGLVARFIYIIPESTVGYRDLEPPSIPMDLKNAFEEKLHEMFDWSLDSSGERHEIKLSEGADEVLKDFQARVEPELGPGGVLEDIRDWAGKFVGTTVRVAAVMHAIECDGKPPWSIGLHKETMERAIGMMEVASKHALVVLLKISDTPEIKGAKKILDWIRKRGCSKFTEKQLKDSVRNGNILGDDILLQKALAVLYEHGYVRFEQVKPPGKGRPSNVVYVNDEFFKL